jgi:hypothetical protein
VKVFANGHRFRICGRQAKDLARRPARGAGTVSRMRHTTSAMGTATLMTTPMHALLR